MTRWRMQLHPDRGDESERRAEGCLQAGYVGLDFRTPVGPLPAAPGAIEKGQLHYRRFESEMREGDLVLVQAGYRPFALVEIDGPYEYDSERRNDRRLWFRHMRRVRNVRLYRGLVPDPKHRERLPFRMTLARIHDPHSPAFRLIDAWLAAS